MAGLDPETTRWLTQLGIAATLIASLIAAAANLIGQWIQRGTAKQVAQIQAEAQRDLDHRKARREYREQIMAPLRALAARRLGMVVALQDAVKAGDDAKIDELAEQILLDDIGADMSFYGLVEPHLLEQYELLANWSTNAAHAAKERHEGGDLPSLVARLGTMGRETLEAVEGLNREIERYVLSPPVEPLSARAPSGGTPDTAPPRPPAAA